MNIEQAAQAVAQLRAEVIANLPAEYGRAYERGTATQAAEQLVAVYVQAAAILMVRRLPDVQP